jgi:hypothetical protein
MEQSTLVVSALIVGVVLGLAFARWAAHRDRGGVGGAELEAELRRMVQDGRLSQVTFLNFGYYLR